MRGAVGQRDYHLLEDGQDQTERGESDPFAHFVSVVYTRHSIFGDFAHPPPHLNNRGHTMKDVFWTPYVYPIYILCPWGTMCN